MVAVQQGGRALEFVPEQLKTHDICMVAVQQNGQVQTQVPEQHKSACEAVIKLRTST
jgi:hypothetical protein